jgi:hypothetical protein
VAPVRRAEPDVRIARHEPVHEILRDPPEMTVLEHEPPIARATRRRGGEVDRDHAAPVAQDVEIGELERHEPERYALAVDRQRQIAEHALRVPPLLR